FAVVDGKILFGLTAIKGVGRGAAEHIAQVRQEDGPYHDFFELCERVDPKIVSKSALERLIKAGACDGFGRRAQLMAVLPRALQAAAALHNDRRAGQASLFGSSAAPEESVRPAEVLPDVPEWSDTEKLKYEKEALD